MQEGITKMIANIQHGKIGRGKTPKANPISMWKWSGYHDVRNGKGFTAQYDKSMTRTEQLAYEQGRAHAKIIEKEWGVIPDWDYNELFTNVLYTECESDVYVIDGILRENDFRLRGK
jgi:hypothetical protein